MLSKALYYLCMEIAAEETFLSLVPRYTSSRRLGCSPHATLRQAAGNPAILSQLESSGRWGRNLPPTRVQRDSQLRNETRTNPTTYHSIAQVFQWPWGAEKDSLVSPPMNPATAQAWQPPFPPQHGVYQLDQSKRKQWHLHQKHYGIFSPWPYQLFINRSKILLCCNSQRAGFPISLRHQPRFLKLKSIRTFSLCLCVVCCFNETT